MRNKKIYRQDFEDAEEVVYDEKIKSGLRNYYGEIIGVKFEEKYYLILEDCSGIPNEEISEEFYNAFKKEFTGDKNDR